jgi:aspartate/methionine/tyrosine aminotransferase
MSGYAQMHLLKGFLSSPEKIEAYTLVNNDRIFRSARCLFGLLNDLGIDYIHPNSGIFLFVDMSSLFSIHTFEGEQKLHRKLYEKCGVLFTPGQDCHCPKPGWFRVCFAWVPLTALKNAFEKIADSIDFLKA